MKSVAEKLLFSNPVLYRAKCFLIETVVWKWLLGGVFRLKQRPLGDTEPLFRAKQVLLAACGPGNTSTGPSIDSAAEVYAFDISQDFVTTCRTNRPHWKVCRADALKLPYADGAFEVSVIYSALHHIPARADLVLAELARVTRSRIVILEGVVPETGLLRRMLLIWYRLVDGGVHYYTREEILAIADQLGLRVQRATQHGPISHMMFSVLAPGSE
jgi:ubiquinone/menaquinone biosynthesis C-methylase UbiE